MKLIPRYITSVTLRNRLSDKMNIFLGLEENGTMKVYYGDTTELSQDKNYINEASFPNRGILAHGKYSMWFCFFSRYVNWVFEEEI